MITTVFLIVVVVFLIAMASIDVPTGNLGKFERERRIKQGGLEVERELSHDDIVSTKHILEVLLLVTMAALAVVAFGWILGCIVAVIVALEYGAIARLVPIRRYTAKLYGKVEPLLIRFTQQYGPILKYVRVFSPEVPELSLHSREELLHVIETADKHVLSSDERKLITSSLTFSGTEVRDVMVPRSVINTVAKGELLGPLVLDDLHKKGHSRFPVIDGDIDHVVGILYVRDLLTLNTQKKHTARVDTAMESRVFYINERQTLDHALHAFISTHHHLFIVINEYRETVGLLTLEDVLEAMIGRKIIDEFDAHDDLRAVAARHPESNLSAASHETV